MTICIAAFAGFAKKSLLLCTDQMVTQYEGTRDKGMLKIRSIHADWGVMYSANNITHVKPITDGIRSRIPDKKKPLTLQMVQSIVQDSFVEQLRREQEGSFLAKYHLSVAAFNSKGRKIFGDTLFEKNTARLEGVEVGCEFLVGGFDEQLSAHIFTVGNPGHITIYDDLGFWAVGSGRDRALNSLYDGFDINMPIEAALYRILEAKFRCEGHELGIGQETSLVLMDIEDIPRGSRIEHDRIVVREIKQSVIAELRKIWKRRAEIPARAINICKDAASTKVVFA